MRLIKKTLPCGVVLRQISGNDGADKNYVEFHIEPTGPETATNFIRAYNEDERPGKGDFVSYKRQADIIVARKNLPALRIIIDQLIKQKV